MTTNVTVRLTKAGCATYVDHAPLLQPPHVQSNMETDQPGTKHP